MAEQVSFFGNFIAAMQGAQDRKRQTALDTARLVMEQNNYKLESKRLDAQIGQQTATLDFREAQLAERERTDQLIAGNRQLTEEERARHDKETEAAAKENADTRQALAKSTEALNAVTGQYRTSQKNVLDQTALRIKEDTKERVEHTRLIKAEADIAAKKVNYTDLAQKLALAKDRAQINEINQQAALKAGQLRLIDPHIRAENALSNMHNASATLDRARARAVGNGEKTTAWNTIATGARTSKEAVDRAQKKADDLQAKILQLENGINAAEMANAGVDTDYDHLMLRDAQDNATNVTVTSAMNTIKGYTDPRTGKKAPGLQDQLDNALRGLAQVQDYHNTWQDLYNQYAGEVIKTPSGKKIKIDTYQAPPAARAPHVAVPTGVTPLGGGRVQPPPPGRAPINTGSHAGEGRQRLDTGGRDLSRMSQAELDALIAKKKKERQGH